MRSYLTKYIDVVQIKQPICIVYHKRFSIREIDETAHLLFEAVTVMLDLLRCHHTSHISSSGWISDISCTTTDQCDWLVSCFLQTFHQAQCHEMSYMKTVCCRVESDIECSLSIIYKFFDSLFICYLGDQASCLKFFINSHLSSPSLFVLFFCNFYRIFITCLLAQKL